MSEGQGVDGSSAFKINDRVYPFSVGDVLHFGVQSLVVHPVRRMDNAKRVDGRLNDLVTCPVSLFTPRL